MRPHLQQILREGGLRLATESVDGCERPGVWFSSNQTWESTVNKLPPSGDRGFLAHAKILGVARIGVTRDTAPVSWEDYCRISGLDLALARGFERSGNAMGASSSEWYVSFDPVPRERWKAIEVSRDGQWGPLKDEAALLADTSPIVALGCKFDADENVWREISPPPIANHIQEKIGRNEPCPCGSGKKFKKCCGFSQR